MKKTFFFFVLAVLALSMTSVDAREFRERRTITTPLNEEKLAGPAEDGSVKLTDAVQLDEAKIKAAIIRLMSNWGTPELERNLSSRFSNRQQLLDAIATDVPFDAKLDVQSVRGIRVLSQRSKQDAQHGRVIVSVVAAEVETDVRYQDPQLGFQKLNGLGEYVFEITTRG